MSKIDRSGAGGSRPIGNQEAAESIQRTSTEPAATGKNPAAAESSATTAKPVVDKNAAGDLIATGNRIQMELNKELDAKKPRDDSLTPEEMAKKVAQNLPRFAPPYVPVGPVVMEDNISAPGQTLPSGPMSELNLRPDQFQFNDQGNLVITNEKLIDFFKSLKETAEGGDIRLAFRKLKPPGEE